MTGSLPRRKPSYVIADLYRRYVIADLLKYAIDISNFPKISKFLKVLLVGTPRSTLHENFFKSTAMLCDSMKAHLNV